MQSAEPTSLKANLKRFFVTLPEPMATFPVVVTISDSFMVHHLRTVMRTKPGERVVAIDDLRELPYEGVIETLEKNSVTLRLERLLHVMPDQQPFVTLAVSLIKEQRWDWMLQKATELGVRAFQPLVAERSVIRLSADDTRKKLERWHAVVRSAAEQSEGLFIPQLLQPVTIPQFCESQQADTFRILLAERGENRTSLKAYLPKVPPGQAVIIAIGPEGGWSEAEVATFLNANFEAVSLGSRILRSETAAIAALSAVVYECGM